MRSELGSVDGCCSAALAADEVLQPVKPADMTAALTRCEGRGFDLLLCERKACLQRFPFLVWGAIPIEQGASLGEGEFAAGELPAMQVLAQLLLRVRFGGFGISSGPSGSASFGRLPSLPTRTPGACLATWRHRSSEPNERLPGSLHR